MPLPLVTDRPEKQIDSILSRWNAGDLPLIYDITNTKWPINSEDSTIAITSITDDNGSAKINRGSNDGEVVKEWILIDGTTNYEGPQQITAVDGNNLTIDAPFVDNDTGTTLIYFQNYTTLIRVNVGLDPTHEHVALKPNTLVGTIEQRPDTDNITLADVKEYVKNKMNFVYDESQTSWPNDVNAWTDFYISFAERYDLVTAGVVGDFTSAFTDDTNVDGIIFLHAIHGALQFGDARGGNMFDFVVFDSTDAGGYFDGEAKFMTFFERLKIIDFNNFNVSIILDKNAEYPDLNIIRLEITEFDQNGNVLLITISAIDRQDYGLYRIDLNGLVFQDDTTDLEIVLLDTNDFEVSETKVIDIDVECFVALVPENLTAELAASVDVAWTNTSDVLDINIKRSQVTGGPYTIVGTVLAGNTTFNDPTVDDGRKYFFVAGYVGEPQNSNEDSVITPFETGNCVRMDGVDDILSALGLSETMTDQITWVQFSVMNDAEGFVGELGGMRGLTSNKYTIDRLVPSDSIALVSTYTPDGGAPVTQMLKMNSPFALRPQLFGFSINFATEEQVAFGINYDNQNDPSIATLITSSRFYTGDPIDQTMKDFTTNYLGGRIQDTKICYIAIVDKALSSAELLEVFNSGAYRRPDDIVGADILYEWEFDETSGTNVPDTGPRNIDLTLVNFADTGFGAVITYSAASGTFTVGEKIQQTTAASGDPAEAIVVSDDTVDTLEIKAVRGYFDTTEGIEGVDSGETATVDAITYRAWDEF